MHLVESVRDYRYKLLSTLKKGKWRTFLQDAVEYGEIQYGMIIREEEGRMRGYVELFSQAS